MAAPFDPGRLLVTGPTVPVSDGILANIGGGAAQFDFSTDGLLAYIPGTARSPENRLVWVDRRGGAEPIPAPLRNYIAVRVSPEGRRLALGIGAANDDIWILDLGRGALTRLTHGGGNHDGPVWTPDGGRVAFGAERGGPWNVFSVPADGAGGDERLTSDPAPQFPLSFSPDSRSMAFSRVSPKTKHDIWLLSLEGQHAARPLLETPYDEGQAMISPDGHWMAYTSDESGRREVYVSPFPGPHCGSLRAGTRTLPSKNSRRPTT